MKITTKILGAVCAALFAFTPLVGATQDRAVEITGEIFEIDHLPFWQGVEGEPMPPFSFRAVVVENTGAQLDTQEGPVGGGIYIDSVRSVTFEVFDGSENLLYADEFTPPVTGGTGPEGGSASYFIPGDGESEFVPYDNAMWVAAPGVNSEEPGRVVSLGILAMLFTGADGEMPMPVEMPAEFTGELFADLTGYPLLFEGETFYPFQYVLFEPFNEQEEQQATGFYGLATFIQYIDLDADGDGVPDALDVCSPTILNENVEFASIDTGVPNVIDESGCSIMDRYAACHVEEEPVRGIRSVRRGPSSCEKAVSYDLVADGLISYAEARMLRNALYSAKTSVADNPLYQESTTEGENPLFE